MRAQGHCKKLKAHVGNIFQLNILQNVGNGLLLSSFHHDFLSAVHSKQTKQAQYLTSVLCNLHHRAARSLLSLRVILSIIIIARVKMIISFWQATLLWSTLACQFLPLTDKQCSWGINISRKFIVDCCWPYLP